MRQHSYLPDMSEPGITALAECAHARESSALRRFFYDHLRPNPSVDVALTVTQPPYPLPTRLEL